MRRRSLQSAIFYALLAFSVSIALLVVLICSSIFQKSQINDAYKLLEGEVDAIVDTGEAPNSLSVAELKKLEITGVRLTLIAADGQVEFDSLTPDPTSLPNHLQRPEVQEALKKGSARSLRSSSTAGNVSVYFAHRLSTGEILRLSTDRAALTQVLLQELGIILGLIAGLILLSYLLARRLAKSLVLPILDLDIKQDQKVEAISPYAELDPLVSRLNVQQQELAKKLDTAQMASAMRRHFTANITHELKTPIASIMGASEMIRDGICRDEDIKDFAGRINAEAKRLSALVSDILTLSKLEDVTDESARDLFGEKEQLDLYQVTEDVIARLRDKAEAREIKLELKGSHCVLLGYPKLIDIMISNLVDNAIRYNKEKGQVFVFIHPQAEGILLQVQDTGIGIAPEHQEKIFQRFWRVDKSRSKELGGTGLGLAIVKHAAALHKAHIKLTSAPGEGSCISVSFTTTQQ